MSVTYPRPVTPQRAAAHNGKWSRGRIERTARTTGLPYLGFFIVGRRSRNGV